MKIKLNSLLQIVNFLIIIGLICSFLFDGTSQYIDAVTIIIGIIFALINCLACYIENKRYNPFILLLIIFIDIFYLFRIITLNATSMSHSIELSGPITSLETNTALLYILLSSIFLITGS